MQPNHTYVSLQLIGIRTEDQLCILQLVLGSLTGIGNRKPIFEVNNATEKKKRRYLSNSNIIKRVDPLPDEVNEAEMKVHLRGTNKNGIDFIYDSTTSLLKIQIRYTTLIVKTGEHVTLQQILNIEYSLNGYSVEVINENHNHNNQQDVDNEVNNNELSLINESFYDCNNHNY